MIHNLLLVVALFLAITFLIGPGSHALLAVAIILICVASFTGLPWKPPTG